jgi:aspartyl-tRNA(Asn)/glutamyl-tRNA(Gln) amidotransferase subunit C
MDINTIERTATLARLHLSDEEKQSLVGQLTDILGYVEKINELDTSSVKPTDHVAGLCNIFREDAVTSGNGTEALAKVAPEFENGHLVVPKIIDGE